MGESVPTFLRRCKLLPSSRNVFWRNLLVSAICRFFFFCYFLRNVARDNRKRSSPFVSFAVDASRSSTRVAVRRAAIGTASQLLFKWINGAGGSEARGTFEGEQQGFGYEGYIFHIQMVPNQKQFVSVIPRCESNRCSFSLDADKNRTNVYQSYRLSRRDGCIVTGGDRDGLCQWARRLLCQCSSYLCVCMRQPCILCFDKCVQNLKMRAVKLSFDRPKMSSCYLAHIGPFLIKRI